MLKTARPCLVGALLLLISACAAGADSLRGVRIAVTIDDLPGYTRAEGMSRREAMGTIVDALEENGVAGAIGFVTDSARAGSDEDDAILQDWLDARFRLGNHTASHRGLNEMSADDFIADIDAEENSLSRFSEGVIRAFRYPGLFEGDTDDKRDTVREYLARQDYIIAHVSLHYDDWAWTSAYTRCLGRGDQAEIANLRERVLTAANVSLERARSLSHSLAGRDVAYILLIHPSAFTAQTLGNVLADWRERGARFISFEEAARDPIYQIDPDIADRRGRPFLEQLASLEGIEDTIRAPEYAPSRLYHICRPAAASPG